MEQHDGSLVLVVYAAASFYLVVSALASALIGCIFGEQAGMLAMGGRVRFCLLFSLRGCAFAGVIPGNAIHPGNGGAA
ncbi:MAG: hypothetical protein ACLRX5_01440 [Slackia sp.]